MTSELNQEGQEEEGRSGAGVQAQSQTCGCLWAIQGPWVSWILFFGSYLVLTNELIVYIFKLGNFT